MATGSKKVTRKDIAKMSFRDFLRNARGPYGRLFGFMKPYMRRFWMGMLFAVLFAMANGALVGVIKHAGDLVLPSNNADGTSKLPGFLREWAKPDADGRSPMVVVITVCLAIPLVMALRGLFSFLNAYYVLWVC